MSNKKKDLWVFNITIYLKIEYLITTILQLLKTKTNIIICHEVFTDCGKNNISINILFFSRLKIIKNLLYLNYENTKGYKAINNLKW